MAYTAGEVAGDRRTGALNGIVMDVVSDRVRRISFQLWGIEPDVVFRRKFCHSVMTIGALYHDAAVPVIEVFPR